MGGGEGVPTLVPARMLNELVYCPRLFYLEWVDARWADSEDTEQGRFTHRAVDRPTGALPEGAADDLLGQARSVRIEDDDLGLVAVIDRVEFSDGEVLPVEVKKGRPPPGGSVWPADRAQVLVHVVLLRRKGFRVERALLYYAATNSRVDVDLGAPGEAEAEVRGLVEQAREVSGQLLPPLPLIDSPRCPRCSLVGLCLPDETNAILQRSTLTVRRIVPRDSAHRPLYVTEQGAFVGVKGGRVVVTKAKEPLADIRLLDVSQLCLYGRVQVSSEALARLWAQGVPVLWFSFGGWLRGWAQGEPSRYVELRRRQVIVHGQGGLAMARPMIAAKIANQRVLLRRNARSDVTGVVAQLGVLRAQALTARSAAELLGIEGTAARLYFGRFTSMLTSGVDDLAARFDGNGRARRPAPDPVNALLGYVYGLLVKDIVAVCLGVGLDPFIGVLHRPRFGRPALALDLAEEFRALIADSVVLQVLNNCEVRGKDFLVSSRGASLTATGRRAVIRAYERRLDVEIKHPTFGYTISYRRVLDVQARIAAAVMVGELEHYVPMTTR